MKHAYKPSDMNMRNTQMQLQKSYEIIFVVVTPRLPKKTSGTRNHEWVNRMTLVGQLKSYSTKKKMKSSLHQQERQRLLQKTVNTASNLVHDADVFSDECKMWRKLEHANQTWAELQSIFIEAHQDLQE